MNNIQLAIFLDKYRALLEVAIDEVRGDLPEECFVCGENLLGGDFRSVPVLDPLYNLLGVLNDDVDALKSGADDS